MDTCKHCGRKLDSWDDAANFIEVTMENALHNDRSEPASASTWRARVEAIVRELKLRRQRTCATCDVRHGRAA